MSETIQSYTLVLFLCGSSKERTEFQLLAVGAEFGKPGIRPAVVRGVISRHSELIKRLVEINPQEGLAPAAPPGKIGHTPLEVIIGVIFGVFFAFAFIGV